MSEFAVSANRPLLLVSVRDAQEAETARACGADLVDAKDPDRGALGALPVDVVAAIVACMAGRVATSAVAGEPVGGDELARSVRTLAGSGVDYVKVAVRPDFDVTALARAAAAAPGRLIGVLLAEDGIGPGIVAALASAGFRGAMVDTRGKTGRGLTDLVPPERIAAFIAECRAHRLLSGLAGSLRAEDVPALSAHSPDYLGFRGGFCRGGDRRGSLDPARIEAVVRALRAVGRRDAA